jgi:hypothetical protein
MASLAPTRFATQLADDGTERLDYWETTWVPASVPGLAFQGDQTVLSADGVITFIDCHVLPGAHRVYPFGDWPASAVEPVSLRAVAEEHGPSGTVLSTHVLVPDEQNRLFFTVHEGTERVVSQ